MASRLQLVLSMAVGGLAIHGVIAACGSIRSMATDAQVSDGVVQASDGATQANDATAANDMNIPTGTIIAFAGTTAPVGWAICDGSEVNRIAYATLFAIIGVTFGGGDGVNTFDLPSLQGRAIIGAGQGNGLSKRSIGEAVGEESHTLTISELPAHSHLIIDPGHAHSLVLPGSTGVTAVQSGGPNQGVSGGGTWAVQATARAATGITTSNTGGGSAYNNMQPSTVMSYLIKL
jgi:microcystin-dependent protein